MALNPLSRSLDVTWVDSLLARVVVAVDGTEEGFEACRQVARLATPGTGIEAVSVAHISDDGDTQVVARRAFDPLGDEARAALGRAKEILGAHSTERVLNGFITAAVLKEIERGRGTLLAIGTHGHSRLAEIVVGGPGGELLHLAPCSVLVARAPRSGGSFPSSIVVGVDGSPEADAGLAAARQLADRFAVPLRAVTALRSSGVNLVRARTLQRLEEVDEKPVPALVAASRTCDLLVVGSRGLRGPKALGSVAERVAHEAACSVLVVRDAGAFAD